MTEMYFKGLLQDFFAIQEKLTLLKEHSKIYGKDISSLDYKKQEFQLKVIESAMSILNSKEHFIVKNHLVLHNTWLETADLFEKTYGKQNTYSDRTLKRIQSRAVKKMVDFINSSPVKNCFNDN